ncbi:MAG: ABC transporter ATP-binding protein [Hyphomicrobiaceae bacterium]
MTEPLVKIENVDKLFGETVVVSDLNLTIESGEFLAIMGPSGCGKTTTLRMLAGLEIPTAGEIRFEGRLMNDVRPHERDTPLVWQSLALFPFLNARENIEFGLKMRGVGGPERRRRARDWLDRLDIGELSERNVETLSGGQRQRVALARSLVIEPQILLLDEPLSALDAHLVIRMQAVLARLQRELGITFVYVTHSQSEAFAMADRVVIMSKGEIAQIGTPRDIYRAPSNRFVAEFVGRNNIIAGRVQASNAGHLSIESSTGMFVVETTDPRPVGSEATFVIAADRVQLSESPLDLENVLSAKLISEEFVGSVVTLFLEAADGTEFKVQAQERDLVRFDLKEIEDVFLGWSASGAHLLTETST